MMEIIPAIDLRGGKVVRLERGNFDKETVYSESPLETARKWISFGAKRIHIVDLDGALRGGINFNNLKIVKEIKNDTGIAIEFGGGIRSEAVAREVFEAGVGRVVIGSRALDKDFLSGMINSFGNQKVVVGIDAMNRTARVAGWTSDSKISAIELAKMVEKIGVRTIIYTDIAKDGMLSGPNIEGIKGMLKSVSLNIIASGGISSIDDIVELKALNEDRLAGIIIGKALYEGKIDLGEAIKICQGPG